MPDPLDLLKTTLADRYRVDREIGRGGMAHVFLAHDLKLDRRVALKVLRPDLAAVLGGERFLREITLAAKLEHPHILGIYDSGEAGGILYYVMPYVEGESLRDRLRREKQLPVDEALQISREVADALSYAHARGVIHRDIKPENILLRAGHAVVADFGIAWAIDAAGGDRLTETGLTLGTPAYMSPEQAAGSRELDGRSDLYALGCVLYEMLAGEPPFTGPTTESLIHQHLAAEPPNVTSMRPAVPSWAAAALRRTLAKAPADRFNPVAQFAEAIAPRAFVTEVSRPRAAAGLWGSRVLLAAAAVVVVGGGIWLSGIARRSAGSRSDGRRHAADVRRLFVMPLHNVTADSTLAVWSVLAAEWIGNAIDRALLVPVVPASAVRDAIAALGGRASVDSVAGRVAASYAVAGTLARTGSQLRFQLELLDTRTGDRLRALEPVAGPADSVDVLVTRLADAAAAAVVAMLDPDAPPWTENAQPPPSVEAYEQYLAQVDLFCRDRYAESIEAGKRAVQLAPDFPWALGYIVTAYYNLGRYTISDSLIRIYESMPGRRPTAAGRAQWDWFVGIALSDRERSTRGADEMFRLAPTALGYLAAKASLATGQATEAVERNLATDISLPCWRNRRPRWLDLAEAYHLLGRYQEELDIVRDGLGRFPGDRTLMDDEARAFAAMDQVERVDSVVRAMDALAPQPGRDRDIGLVDAALELLAHGHADAGARMLDQALTRLEARPPEEARYHRARAYYYLGRWADAEPIFATLVKESPDNWDYLGFYGATLARLRRVENAEAMSRTLGAMRLPWLRGRHIFGQVLIAAALGQNEQATALLQRAFENYYHFSARLHVEPTFEALKNAPRWVALVTPQ